MVTREFLGLGPHGHPADASFALLPPLLAGVAVVAGTALAISPALRSRATDAVSRVREALVRDWREHPAAMLLVIAVWALGAALRLSLPSDIEYKGDEAWMFHAADGLWRHERWPAVGMPSSVGLQNPGASVWVFLVLTALSGADNPVELARAVAMLNIVALTAVLLFAWRRPDKERPVWLWTVALAAVDPLGVLLQRKIWAQSVLPIFVWLLFLLWRARSRPLAAFCWGVLGAFVGQIHMSGFFFVPVFVLWAAYASLRPKDRQITRWKLWLAGTVIGALPLVAWLRVSLRPVHVIRTNDVATGWVTWLQDAIGWNLGYSLGPDGVATLSTWPLVAGRPTYLILAVLMLSVLTGVVLLVLLVREALARPAAIVARMRWEGAIAHNLAFFGFSLMMFVLRLPFYRYYLLVAFPFVSMTVPLVAYAAGRRTAWSGIIWGAHALVAVCLLWFLHVNFGAADADYGVTYQFQVEHVPE